MSLQHFGKGALRVAKNYTKGYSDVQTKVRDATSNDPWGPTGAQMNEIAQMTYNQNDFVEIMEMLDKRLNDKGKNWRHVFKALTVLDYLLHNGSENVIIYFRDNVYIVKTLKEFQYVDEYAKDQGANVRQKAKDISNLLQDESRLREERRNRASMRDRMVRGASGVPDEFGEDENAQRRSRANASPAGGPSSKRGGRGDDDELRKAIEESKRSLAAEQAKTAEEMDLAKAIQLSEEEEARRNKSVEESNQRALFDDQAQAVASPSTNNPFPLVDPSQYSQQQLQPQFTSMMPQFTSFNPYQQQAQQEAMQQQYMLQQQEWMRQQQEAQQAQAMQAQAQQEEWNRQQQQQQQLMLFQQQQQQQPLFPQQTSFGSNNPFAAQTFGQSPAQSPPLASSSSNASTLDSFSLPSTFASSPSPARAASAQPPISSPGPAPGMRPTKSDAEHSHLANLLANREDGMDTFGNTGQLRYGHTSAGRLAAQQTANGGHNPFAPQQVQQGNEQPFFTI